MILLFKVHFSIPYTVIRPFWAVTTAVRTVRALKKYLWLRLWHPRNRRPTVCVQLIPVMVQCAPLASHHHYKSITTTQWDNNDNQLHMVCFLNIIYYSFLTNFTHATSNLKSKHSLSNLVPQHRLVCSLQQL